MTSDGRFEQIKLDLAGKKDSVLEIPFDEILPAQSYIFRSKSVPHAIKVPMQIVYDQTFLEGMKFCGKDCGEDPDTYIDRMLIHLIGIYQQPSLRHKIHFDISPEYRYHHEKLSVCGNPKCEHDKNSKTDGLYKAKKWSEKWEEDGIETNRL